MIVWLGQVPTNTTPPDSVLAAVIWLGGVIVAGLLVALRTLWKDNQRWRDERDTLLRELLTVTIDASNRIQDSEIALEAATAMLATVTANQMKPEALTEISFHLRHLREMQNRTQNGG